MSADRGPLGIPWEAFDLLDPALREALLEGRLAPEELHELEGWLGKCLDDHGLPGHD